MKSPISVNAHLAYIHNYPLFIERMKRLNPAVLLAYVDSDNDMKMIEALPAQLPETIIIGRVYHDDEGAFHLPGDRGEPMIATPTNYLNKYGRLGKNGMYLNVMNEPGSAGDLSDLINWHLEAIAKADRDNTAIAPFAWGVGHPQVINGEWDSQLDDVLRAMAKRPDLFLMNVHEYMPDQTPHRIGRLYAYLKRCGTLGIKPNRVVITEAGFDTAGGPENGYQSRDVPGDEFARILINLCNGIYKPLIEDGTLLGLCVFSYGNSGKWKSFDVQGDDGFFQYLFDHKSELPQPITKPTPIPAPTPPPPVIVPPVVPVPVDPGTPERKIIRTPGHFVNLRATPAGVDAGDVANGTELTRYSKYEIVGIDKHYYVHLDGGGHGWVSDQAGKVKFEDVAKPPVDHSILVGKLLATRADLDDEINRLQMQAAEAERLRADYADRAEALIRVREAQQDAIDALKAA